jgi:peptide/nickel transport system substrate-binding protein
MVFGLLRVAIMAAIIGGWLLSTASFAADEPKHGGILHLFHRDSPGSPSILEESSNSVNTPFMAVFNNLVIYDQDIPRNSVDTIRPDLASSWAWNADKTELTFKLHEGVKWHDGKPFTAADVKCTWDLLQGKGAAQLRINPRDGWYHNLKEVVTNGDYEVTFRLARPQPAMLALIASGYSVIYPCHVPPAQMRQHPIGTGPFKFVDFKRNESIKLTRNTDYWKPGLPYLDGVEFQIITNSSTAMLAFSTGQLDMTFPTEITPPLLKAYKATAPNAVCKLVSTNCATNLLMNREKPPFDEPDIRRAVALALDRKSFIDIISDGQGVVGAAMQPAPDGIWGMPDDMLRQLPGYDPDVEKNRAEARKLMEKHGYSASNPLRLKVSARNVSQHRDAGVILVDQLKSIYIDAEFETVETANWFPKIERKDYVIGPNVTCGAIDDPDQNFYENYSCGAMRNFSRYCNKELETLFDKQSQETDIEKRRRLVWEIDRRLQQDIARPIVFHTKTATCWQPYVKGYTPMVNSIYNSPRFETVWLDK